MKRKILLFIILLILPFSLLFAQSMNLTISFDMSSITSEGIISVCFSQGKENTVPATQQMGEQCNYLDYNAITPSKLINLNIINEGNSFYAKSPDFCYVNWKVYYKDGLDIILKVNGPLKSSETNDEINWQVSLHDPTLKAQEPDNVSGTLDDGPFEYSTSELLVHTTSTPNFGRSGGRAFDIQTQSLWGKELKSYGGELVAIIRTRG